MGRKKKNQNSKTYESFFFTLVWLLVGMLINAMYYIFIGTLRLSLELFGYWEYKRFKASILLTEKNVFLYIMDL
jgi:hypothetical protein